jgi:hypothetical protein
MTWRWPVCGLFSKFYSMAMLTKASHPRDSRCYNQTMNGLLATRELSNIQFDSSAAEGPDQFQGYRATPMTMKNSTRVYMLFSQIKWAGMFDRQHMILYPHLRFLGCVMVSAGDERGKDIFSADDLCCVCRIKSDTFCPQIPLVWAGWIQGTN